MKISGFTFVHDALNGGYPIREAVRAVADYCDEVVAVDMQSTDGTRAVLESLGCRIVDGQWGTKAEMTLCKAHALHTECRHDQIVMFEADEVWDDRLIRSVVTQRLTNALVYRIQVEQNFQKMRWSHHLVHRVFQKGKAHKDPNRGHTSKEHDSVPVRLSPDHGLIYDCCYCFRDQWESRAIQNGALWGESPQLLRCTPDHFLYKPQAESLEKLLADERWTFKTSPFDLPDILKPLVGVTKYE